MACLMAHSVIHIENLLLIPFRRNSLYHLETTVLYLFLKYTNAAKQVIILVMLYWINFIRFFYSSSFISSSNFINSFPPMFHQILFSFSLFLY